MTDRKLPDNNSVLPVVDEANPWQTLDSEVRYDNPWIQVIHHNVPEKSDSLQAAKRELLEETGIIARQWTPLLELHLSNSVSDELAIGYIAQDLQFEAAQPEDSEDLTVVKVPFDDVLQMAMDGRISDALAVACVLKAARLIDAGQL